MRNLFLVSDSESQEKAERFSQNLKFTERSVAAVVVVFLTVLFVGAILLATNRLEHTGLAYGREIQDSYKKKEHRQIGGEYVSLGVAARFQDLSGEDILIHGYVVESSDKNVALFDGQRVFVVNTGELKLLVSLPQ